MRERFVVDVVMKKGDPLYKITTEDGSVTIAIIDPDAEMDDAGTLAETICETMNEDPDRYL